MYEKPPAYFDFEAVDEERVQSGSVLDFFSFLFFFAVSWAFSAAYGGSQARGPIRAVAAWLTQEPEQRGV